MVRLHLFSSYMTNSWQGTRVIIIYRGENNLTERRISKSKYVAGLQCLKYLWYLVNEPGAIPPFDEATLLRFQRGHDVGNFAKSLFPGGIEIEHGVDIEAELARARELANLDVPTSTVNNNRNTGPVESASRGTAGSIHPLFEAAFTYKNAFARADILEPVFLPFSTFKSAAPTSITPATATTTTVSTPFVSTAAKSASTTLWNIIEVKSSYSIKDVNMHDISFQKYCYEGAGLKINKCYLMYLNKDFIKDGPIRDPHQFFAVDDVTAETEIIKAGIEGKLNLMLEAISSKTCPNISTGRNCYNPYDCPLESVC